MPPPFACWALAVCQLSVNQSQLVSTTSINWYPVATGPGSACLISKSPWPFQVTLQKKKNAFLAVPGTDLLTEDKSSQQLEAESLSLRQNNTLACFSTSFS